MIMRVPKREDQSLFILLFNCHTSIILALRGSVNPFSKFFFQNGGGGNRTLVFVGSDMRLSPNRLPLTPPIKKKTVRAGQTLPRNYHRTLSILDEDFTPHQDLLFTLYMYKDYRA